jgi:hypothetical protein
VTVRDGYTVSSPTAAFGRIGELYVMRDNNGNKVALPVATEPDHLREVWSAFQSAAVHDRPMPATLFGEFVQSDTSVGGGPSRLTSFTSVGSRHLTDCAKVQGDAR